MFYVSLYIWSIHPCSMLFHVTPMIMLCTCFMSYDKYMSWNHHQIPHNLHPASQESIFSARQIDDISLMTTINIWNCKIIQHQLMHEIYLWSKLPMLWEEFQRLREGPLLLNFQHMLWRLLNAINDPLSCNDQSKCNKKELQMEYNHGIKSCNFSHYETSMQLLAHYLAMTNQNARKGSYKSSH